MNLGRENSFRLLLLLGSTWFAVLLAELVLSVFADEISYRINTLTGRSTRMQTARLHGATVDTRGVLQIANDLSTKAQQVVIRMSPTFIANNSGEMFALAGMSKKLTIHCNEFGSPVTYQSDEYGFRNPLGLYHQGKVDMVLLGDSFTHGSCVPEGKEVASLLRKNRQVLNLGYSSNGPLIELATLREYAKPLAPAIVLWMYYEGNDLKNLKHSVQEYKQLLAYLKPDYSRNLINRQPEIDRKLAQVYVEYLKKHAHRLEKPTLTSKLVAIVKLKHLRSLASKAISHLKKNKQEQLKHFFSYPPTPLFRQVLLAAKTEVAAWGGQLYFVYLPTWTRYTADYANKNLAFRDDVLDQVKNLGIPIIDFHSELNRQADALSLFPYRHLGHYTVAGHKLLANLIQISIEQK